MSRVTAALINEIEKTSCAPVYLLHYGGTKKNPILSLLSGSVHGIYALPEDLRREFIWIARSYVKKREVLSDPGDHLVQFRRESLMLSSRVRE